MSENKINQIITENMKRIRKNLKYTRREVDTALNFRKGRTFDFERGRITIKFCTAALYAELYKIDINYLLTTSHQTPQLIYGRVLWYCIWDCQGIIIDHNGNEFYFDRSVIDFQPESDQCVVFQHNKNISDCLCATNVRRKLS